MRGTIAGTYRGR